MSALTPPSPKHHRASTAARHRGFDVSLAIRHQIRRSCRDTRPPQQCRGGRSTVPPTSCLSRGRSIALAPTPYRSAASRFVRLLGECCFDGRQECSQLASEQRRPYPCEIALHSLIGTALQRADKGAASRNKER